MSAELPGVTPTEHTPVISQLPRASLPAQRPCATAPAVLHSFLLQIFVEVFYETSTVLSCGEPSIQGPCPHGAYIYMGEDRK